MSLGIYNGKLALYNGTAINRIESAFKYFVDAFLVASKILSKVAGAAVHVTGATAMMDDPAAYSSGVLPDADTIVIVDAGATLTQPANSDIAIRFLINFGKVVQENGAVPGALNSYAPVGTRLTAEWVCIMPSGLWTEGDGSEGIIQNDVDVSSDIDVELDPDLITRGWTNMGRVVLNGHRRQRAVPVLHDIVGGVTDSLTIGRTMFLGNEASGGDTDLPIVIYPGSPIILPATKAHIAVGGLRQNETVLASGFTLNLSATTFTNNELRDTTGSVITLQAPATVDHLFYHDNATRVAVMTAKGPPLGSPTHGSHTQWAGVPLVLLPERNLKFGITDPAGWLAGTVPVHRLPSFLDFSQGLRAEFFEFKFWGRTNMEQLTEHPGDVVHEADTNLRYRDVIHIGHAGHLYYWEQPEITIFDSDLTPPEGKHWTYLRGLSIYDGVVGAPQLNGAEAKASASCGVTQFNSFVVLEDAIIYNTRGAGFFAESGLDVSKLRGNFCVGQVSENPANPPSTKFNVHYLDGDSGRAGEGYISYGRAIDWVRNFAIGTVGWGAAVLSRSSNSAIPWFDPRFFPFGPESVRYTQQPSIMIDDFVPLRFEGFCGIACGRGAFQIAKNGPQQQHGIAVLVVNCLSINCRNEVDFQYTGNYIVENLTVLGDPDLLGGHGVMLNLSSGGFTFLNLTVRHCPTAVRYWSTDAFGAPRTAEFLGHAFVNSDFASVGVEFDDIHDNGVVFPNVTLPTPFDTAVGFDITSVDSTASSVVFHGRSRDGLGDLDTYPFHFPTDDQNITLGINDIKGAISEHGYWQNTDGTGPAYFGKVRLHKISRLTKKQVTAMYPFPRDTIPGSLGGYKPLPSGHVPPTSSHYRGQASYAAAWAAAKAKANNGLVFE